jgi:hypothetical protein
MSWLYMPEVGGDCSPVGSSDGARSATSSETPTASKSSRRGSKMAGSTMPRSGITRGRSPAAPGVASWMSSLAASRASHSAARATGSPIAIRATFGRLPFALFEPSGPNGAFWRMSQGSLLTLISVEYSATWPRAGLIAHGNAYRLRPLVRLTRGTGYGLLPTPCRADAEKGGRGDLLQVIKGRTSPSGHYTNNLWPTPSSRDHKGAPGKGTQARGGRMSSLPLAVMKFPTPTCGDARNRRASKRAKAIYGAGPTLLEVVWGDRDGGSLNPNWVEWLMGWPIGWTDLRRLATGKFQQWRSQHGSCLASD